TNGPASSYVVLRGSAPGKETTIATGVTTTSYTDTRASDGSTYYYAVEAPNSTGTSGFSNEVKASPVGTPGSPSSLTAAPGSPGVALTWKVGKYATTTYIIYRG